MAAALCSVAKLVLRTLVCLPVLVVLPVLYVVETVTQQRADYTKRLLWVYASASLNDLSTIAENTNLGPHSRTINRFEHDSRVALTIDDAPGDDPEIMSRLLDLFREHKVSVTFFCTTNFITANKDMDAVIKQALADGHELANHMPEDKPYIRVPKDKFEEGLLESSAVLEEYIGKKPSLFRAPSGLINATMMALVEKHDMKHILGDVFSNDPWIGGDYEPPSLKCISYHVNFTLQRTKAGSIIIFHSPNKTNRRQVLPILEKVIPQLLERGFTFDTVSNILGSPGV